MEENAKKIISVLNSRSIRREILDSETIRDIEAIVGTSGNSPISLIGYWGVGEKREVADVDQKALEKLAKIAEMTEHRIKIRLILADMHGAFNGYKNHVYLESISSLAGEKKIDTIYLSAVYEKIGIDVSQFQNISDDIWNKFPECYRCTIEKRAGKHQKICPATEDAKRYLHMTQVEKIKIAEFFPNCIWFTYGDIRNLRDLFPKPIISIWPYKRGSSKLPWFA